MHSDCGYILVVDDDAALRALLRELLHASGYEVREAETGAAAIAAARAERPGLVLLDVQLPGMSGYQVLHMLREDFSGLPVIFMSGERTEAYDRAGGLMLGADDYIVKPFDEDELLARVETLLRRAKTGAASTEEGGVDASGLTSREHEILVLLASGRSPKEISRELVITRKTVSAHIQSILAKLNVHSQAQAVAIAFRNNLVSSDRLLADDHSR